MLQQCNLFNYFFKKKGCSFEQPFFNIIIAGDILINYFRSESTPSIVVSRGHTVSDLCGPETLVIVYSYPGNTEETLSAFNDDVAKEAQVMAPLVTFINGLWIMVPGLFLLKSYLLSIK